MKAEPRSRRCAGNPGAERARPDRTQTQALNLGGVALGGTLFGAGMGLLGYCPGTTMAAIGEKHRDAIAGAVGMWAGALAFIRFYPHLQPVIEKGAFGRRTLPDLTHTSPWLWVAGTSAAVAAGANYSHRSS